MKKLFVLLAVLCLSLASYGQGTNMIYFSHHPISSTEVSSSTYTDGYQDLLDEWTTDPTGDTLTWQNNLVYSLDTAGFWDRMDFLFVFANVTNGDGEALINWINPTLSATAVNSPTFTALDGFTSNGTSSYINTNVSVSDFVNYTLDDATIGIYNTTYTEDNASRVMCGVDDGSNDSYLSFNGSDEYIRINQSSSMQFTVLNSGIGLHVITRRGDTDIEFYMDGSSERTATTSSTALPGDYDFYALARNSGGSPEYYFDETVSILFVMDGVSDAEELSLNTIFETYMDALGTGVQ